MIVTTDAAAAILLLLFSSRCCGCDCCCRSRLSLSAYNMLLPARTRKLLAVSVQFCILVKQRNTGRRPTMLQTRRAAWFVSSYLRLHNNCFQGLSLHSLLVNTLFAGLAPVSVDSTGWDPGLLRCLAWWIDAARRICCHTTLKTRLATLSAR